MITTYSSSGGFLLTRLSRGVTKRRGWDSNPYIISTHTPLARRDTVDLGVTTVPIISPHTPLARRDTVDLGVTTVPIISTHTPLARRDHDVLAKSLDKYNFYSHASREA